MAQSCHGAWFSQGLTSVGCSAVEWGLGARGVICVRLKLMGMKAAIGIRLGHAADNALGVAAGVVFVARARRAAAHAQGVSGIGHNSACLLLCDCHSLVNQTFIHSLLRTC